MLSEHAIARRERLIRGIEDQTRNRIDEIANYPRTNMARVMTPDEAYLQRCIADTRTYGYLRIAGLMRPGVTAEAVDRAAAISHLVNQLDAIDPNVPDVLRLPHESSRLQIPKDEALAAKIGAAIQAFQS